MASPTRLRSCRRESTMQPVDEGGDSIKFPAQAGRFASQDAQTPSVLLLALPLGGFQPLGDPLDLVVQAAKQFPGLRCVGIFNHSGILAPSSALRALDGPVASGKA